MRRETERKGLPEDTDDDDVATSDDECRTLCRVRSDAGGKAAS